MFTLRRPRSAGDPKGPKPIYALRRPQGAGDPKGPKPICNLRRPRSAGDPKGPKPNLLEGGTPTDAEGQSPHLRGRWTRTSLRAGNPLGTAEPNK